MPSLPKTVKNLSVYACGQDYTFVVKIPIGFSPNKTDYALAQVILASMLTRAMDELRSGLIRGGVSPTIANISPIAYRESIGRYLGYRRIGVTKAAPPEWATLASWTPEPGRFDNWFGTSWAGLSQDNQKWFRYTILGIILNFVGRNIQNYCFSTGNTSTLGQSWAPSRQFGDLGNVNGAQVLTRIQFDRQGVEALHQSAAHKAKTPGEFNRSAVLSHAPALATAHHTAMDRVMLAESLHGGWNPEIDMKRPTKKKGANLLDIWSHTLFHELSHGYGNTRDYWYYEKTSTEPFYTWSNEATKRAFLAIRGSAGAAGVNAQTTRDPGYVPNNYPDSLRLANADTVGAYLAGFWSSDEFPVAD